ncbi:unnamed protein product [Auanema sp. JU1783]|nr:unnamed protein product [Auanema sp. JU1783]
MEREPFSSEEFIWIKEIQKEISYEAALHYGLVDVNSVPTSEIVLKIIWETFSGKFVTTYEFLEGYERCYEYRKLLNRETEAQKLKAMFMEDILTNSNVRHSTSGCLSPSIVDSGRESPEL